MLDLILENDNGDKLSFEDSSPFTISDIQGLNPPDATINTSRVALMDGTKYNSAKVNSRTINLAFAIEYEAAKNRLEVYKVLKAKQHVKLYYNGDYRKVFIDGYVQQIHINYMGMKQIVTVSILSPSPYFKEAGEVVNSLSNIVNAFHFPFASTEEPELVFSYFNNDIGISIENEGDIECGLVIELYARNTVSNPKIFNYVTKDFIGLDIDLHPADLVRIDTRQGEKTITLLRDGVETNIFNNIMEGSTWLQLSTAGDTFVYEVGTGESDDLNVTFRHFNLYEGV